jgi:hypothetical protein
MMRVVLHQDGSATKYYEHGDKAIFTGRSDWFLKKGEIVNVLRAETQRGREQSCIDFLSVQTDEHRNGGWGSTKVPPWHLEPSLTGEVR